MIVGLNFVFWAMLPNTIEYGEQATGLHVEGAVFGVAALLQRIAIGIATAILGWSFASAGYVANAQQSAATLAGMRATVALVPLAFLCAVLRRDAPQSARPRARPPHGARSAVAGSRDLGDQFELARERRRFRPTARSTRRTCRARSSAGCRGR